MDQSPERAVSGRRRKDTGMSSGFDVDEGHLPSSAQKKNSGEQPEKRATAAPLDMLVIKLKERDPAMKFFRNYTHRLVIA